MTATIVNSTDIDDRMDRMMDEIHSGKTDVRIRQLAARVLAKKNGGDFGTWTVRERDWKGEIDALYKFVRRNVRYTRDTYNVEVFQRPDRTLQLGIGDCDDLCILLAALLQSVGYAVILRIIALNGGNYQHVYLLVGYPPENPTEWVAVDPAQDHGVGWEHTQGVTLRTDYLVE